MNDQPKKVKIFVDGNCIVCDLEVSHYKRLKPEIFEIVNISAPSFDAAAFGLNVQAVNKDLHVFTSEGKILTGVDSFAYIWSLIPQYQFAAKLIKLPVVYQIAKVGYQLFTWIRPCLPKRERL